MSILQPLQRDGVSWSCRSRCEQIKKCYHWDLKRHKELLPHQPQVCSWDVLMMVDDSCSNISDVFLFLCWSGCTWKVEKRTTHLSPQCALWWQRFALSQSPAVFQPAASACWHTSFWRSVRLCCLRRWPSCSQFPGTTTLTTTGLRWASIKEALNVMRGCINKCTTRRNRQSMDLSGRKQMGQESVMLGVTLISGPQWIPWVRQSWRWRCGIHFLHFPSSIHTKTSSVVCHEPPHQI